MVRPPAADTLRRRLDDGLGDNIAVIVLVALVPVGAADVAALVPVALGYIAVQVVCAAAVVFSPARRRPTDVEVVSP